MTLGWIDFSTQDRQRIEAALNRLTPRGTLDELGLGQIRDGLANRLFPGTSTLHTRSLYFLLVPQLLREIAVKPRKMSVREIIQKLYQKESEAIKYLIGNDETGKAWGIIGKSAGNSLKQKPSGAYWSGIKQFGLVENYGSLRQFVARCLPHWRNGDADFGFSALSQRPMPKTNWLQDQNVLIDHEQASFLRAQIKRKHANSLFAGLISLVEKSDADLFNVRNVSDLFDHPSLTAHAGNLRHCRTYEIICRSALLTYNVTLRLKTNRDPKELYSAHNILYQDTEKWNMTIQDVKNLLLSFPNSDRATATFLLQWSERLFAHTDQELEARQVIIQREKKMKGERARLYDLSRAEAIAPDDILGLRWNKEKATVDPAFDYRWPTVKNHLHDLSVGIKALHA